MVMKAYNFLLAICRHVSYVLLFMVMRFILVYFANSYSNVYFIYNIYDKFFLSKSDFFGIMNALTKVY